MRQRPFFLGLVGSAYLAAASAGASISGCGQTIVVTASGGHGGDDVGGGGGTGFGEGGNGIPSDAAPDYVDPGCPDASPQTDFTCDAFNQDDGDCPPGQGCYVYTQNPQTLCGQEIYGSICEPVGPGHQGDPCDGAQDCGAGLCCVVSGSGNQCAVLCELEGNTTCPAGFVCEPIDVQGFGGCL